MIPRMLLVGSLLLTPTVASAYALETDPSGMNVQFMQKEIVFRLPAKLPAHLDAAAVEQAVKGALAAWAEVSGLTLTAVPGDPSAVPGYSSHGENHNDILFVDDQWSWDSNGVAATILTLDATTHAILDADIVLNASEHRFRVLPDTSVPGGIYDDLQNALTHELGHALGLAHSSVAEATMYPESPRGEVSKRTLAADDIDGIRAIYQPDGAGLPNSDVSSGTQSLQKAQSMGSSGCSSAPGGAPQALGLLGVLAVLAAGLARAGGHFQPVPAKVRRPVERERGASSVSVRWPANGPW
ncbi:MAG TPA: matrixin family metalloprotease [Anaeromyxobacteraceae bacterium]|nr:matrixin family metalloprotease [Anaeromyxobacteraceae bacterium]